MSNDEIKRFADLIREIVKEENQPILEKLDSHTETLNSHTTILNSHTETLKSHTEILKSHTKTLKSHTETLKSQSKALNAGVRETKSISEQVAYLTVKVDGEIIPTLELHTKYFKQIIQRFKGDDQRHERGEENIIRLDKRQKEVEGNLGIQPRPEHQLT